MAIYYNVKSSKSQDKPCFSIWNKETKSTTDCDTVEGEFVRIYTKEREGTTKTGVTFKFTEVGVVLNDKGEERVIVVKQDSFIGRALLNILLKWEELGKLVIRIWRGKTGWDNFTITNNYNGIIDENWFPKYPVSSDKYKELIKVFTKSDGTSINDYGPLNQFLWEEAQKLIPATGVQSTQEDLPF